MRNRENQQMGPRVRRVGWPGLILLLLLPAFVGQAQAPKKNNMLEQLLLDHPDLFGEILENPEKHRVQILYTQIDRDAKNHPRFTSHAYRVNPDEYFYPASTVKLPGAVLALEKLNQLRIPGLDKHTPLRIGTAYPRQTPVEQDTTSREGLATIAHYIKKIFLVSDNDAYNRLYEFLGQQQLNEGLYRKGFKDVRLLHRLSVGDGGEAARHTNPITFYRNDQVLYQQPPVYNPVAFPNRLQPITLGKAYMEGDKLVKQPMDFSDRNYISVETLQGVLKSVLFSEAVPARQRFDLTPDDYRFLYRYLSMLPRESDYPAYDSKAFYDSYVKFFLFGDRKEPMPENIRVFNKVGFAYGFLLDNAYVVDFQNQVEFLLTAVIYVNENEILNDNQYEFEQTGFPFLSNLGKVIYRHELARKRKHKPNLHRFRLDYSSEAAAR
jgi:hypothetical protein